MAFILCFPLLCHTCSVVLLLLAVYSMYGLCEYLVVLTNIAFHTTEFMDFQNDFYITVAPATPHHRVHWLSGGFWTSANLKEYICGTCYSAFNLTQDFFFVTIFKSPVQVVFLYIISWYLYLFLLISSNHWLYFCIYNNWKNNTNWIKQIILQWLKGAFSNCGCEGLLPFL